MKQSGNGQRMPAGVLYMRVSGAAQAESLQRELIRDLCPVPETNTLEYVDAGVSSLTELENRPALGRLIADISNNLVTWVAVASVDRISRDESDWNRFRSICANHDVPILVADEDR